jgi:hypothetical protein
LRRSDVASAFYELFKHTSVATTTVIAFAGIECLRESPVSKLVVYPWAVSYCVTVPLALLALYAEFKAEALVQGSRDGRGLPSWQDQTTETYRVKMHLIAHWLSYSLSGKLNGSINRALVMQDLQILAVKVTRLAFAVSLGLIVTGAMCPDWKLGAGIAFTVLSLAAMLYTIHNQTMIRITQAADANLNELLRAAGLERQQLVRARSGSEAIG